MTSSHSPRHTASMVLMAMCAFVVYDILMLGGFAFVHRITVRLPVIRPHRRHVWSPASLSSAVDEAVVWYPRQAMCLKRSVVAAWLMRLYGTPAQVKIGVRPTPVDSHAWVEVGGTIVNDDPAYQRHFIILDTL